MIKIVGLKLLDTGYVSNETLGTQTQLTDANRAGYTGSAVSSFTLNSVSVSMAGDVNIEQKPIINSLTDNSSSLISVNNRIFTVNCIMAKAATSSGWSSTKEYQFSRLDRTYGLKLLYPSATGDSLTTLVEALGAVNIGGNFSEATPTDDEGTIAATTPYLVGRVKNLRITDNATDKKFWKVSFDFVVSG